jgi:hypothetical protein
MDIKKTLLDLPEQISTVELGLMKMQDQLEETHTCIKLWELSRIGEITDAADEAGKPKFSNDAKRQAELMRLKATNEIYLAFEKDRKEFSQAIKTKEIELRQLYNTQNNLRSICMLESIAGGTFDGR